jgi:hypothetical protein
MDSMRTGKAVERPDNDISCVYSQSQCGLLTKDMAVKIDHQGLDRVEKELVQVTENRVLMRCRSEQELGQAP